VANSHDVESLKNAIKIYEKELQETVNFVKKLRAPENKINDPDILAVISTPSFSRLINLYEKLLNTYREYVKELENR